MRTKLLFSTIICAVLFFATGNYVLASEPPSVFPELHINMTDFASPFEDKTTWREGKITYGSYMSEDILYPTLAEIRGRGNTTRQFGADKPPLRVRFDEPRTMFGSEHAATDWILLANRLDRSLLRNFSALELGRRMEMRCVPMCQNVHLHVNGTYMGVYLFTDERDTHLEIEYHKRPEKSGYFFELDGRAPNEGTKDKDFVMVGNQPYNIRLPNPRKKAHTAYLRDYLEATDYAIRNGSFEEILRLVDLDSFVDFYIVNEFYKNKDSHEFSVFMYITGEGEERRLFMGPLWDFDTSAGNVSTQWLGNGPEDLYVAVFSSWYRDLMTRREFRETVAARWAEISEEIIPQAIEQIRETANHHHSDFAREFERHPNAPPSLRPDFITQNDFRQHVEFLARWLEDRANWMDAYFAGELPDYCHMWRLVEYYMYDSPINLQIGNRPRFLEIPLIRLPNNTKISLHEAERTLGFEVIQRGGIVTMRHDGVTITHRPGESVFTINGNTVDVTYPSVTIREHTFVPLEIIAEAIGYEVHLQDEEPQVLLEYARFSTDYVMNCERTSLPLWQTCPSDTSIFSNQNPSGKR